MKKILLLLLPILLNGMTQSQCLDLVEDEAKKYTRYYTVIMGKAMQETSCGVHLVGDLGKELVDSSLGVLQFRISTARETIEFVEDLKYLLNYSDKRLATELLINHRLSVRLASLRFERYRKAYGVKIAIQAHNGLHGNFRYYKKVMRWVGWINKRRARQNRLESKKVKLSLTAYLLPVNQF